MLEQIDSIEEAKDCFEHEFLEFPSELAQKCVFVKDINSDIVAPALAEETLKPNTWNVLLQLKQWRAVLK